MKKILTFLFTISLMTLFVAGAKAQIIPPTGDTCFDTNASVGNKQCNIRGTITANGLEPLEIKTNDTLKFVIADQVGILDNKVTLQTQEGFTFEDGTTSKEVTLSTTPSEFVIKYIGTETLSDVDKIFVKALYI